MKKSEIVEESLKSILNVQEEIGYISACAISAHGIEMIYGNFQKYRSELDSLLSKRDLEFKKLTKEEKKQFTTVAQGHANRGASKFEAEYKRRKDDFLKKMYEESENVNNDVIEERLEFGVETDKMKKYLPMQVKSILSKIKEIEKFDAGTNDVKIYCKDFSLSKNDFEQFKDFEIVSGKGGKTILKLNYKNGVRLETKENEEIIEESDNENTKILKSQIIKELKCRSNDISVSQDYNSYQIKIKTPYISKEKVEEISKKFKTIHRDGSGGNKYAFVDYDLKIPSEFEKYFIDVKNDMDLSTLDHDYKIKRISSEMIKKNVKFKSIQSLTQKDLQSLISLIPDIRTKLKETKEIKKDNVVIGEAFKNEETGKWEIVQ